jgi:alkanesulfonate monooxygenase SsuD/methylene tetrahydromethanopterin reductase-like flavin-dependent oxidoreductase (luciferase family)
VEFGLFIQGYNPAFRREGNPNAEHQAFMDELAAVQAADEAGFKYVWVTEHHFLDEYSHLSANDVICGYLAHATERIHIGSGIFNPLPQVNHPAKVAERVAMLDHLSNGRFEFGTGRGAGSHEILGFLPDMEDLTKTREIWEDVIGEFPKMWLEDTYQGYQGKYWQLPPRKILPKPYVKPHPPMWYAAGNTSSYEMAARKGLGVLGFSVGDFASAEKAVASYKKAVADAEPIGAFVNDNLMCCIAAYVAEDREEAYRSYIDSRPNYLVSNVFRYHDTFPHPPEVPNWPDRIPEPTREGIPAMLEAGALVLGDPDDALKQAKSWESIGVDQLVFGIGPAPLAETIGTIKLLGEHVIPKVDTNPEHRTSQMRKAAR